MPIRPGPLPLALVIFVACTTSGCGDDGAGADAAQASVELGTGTTEFESLEPGQEVEIIAGEQGGHHFIVHARIRGMLPGDPEMPGSVDNPRTVFRAETEEGERVDAEFPPYRLGYRDAEEETFTLPSGRLLILDPEDESLPDRLYGSRVRLGVRVEDAAGHVATDEVLVRPVPQPQLDGGVADAGPADGG